MANLATLIGAKNLETLLKDDANTYVVVNNLGIFERYKNSSDINFGDVVGIGNYQDCGSLVSYLNLHKFAVS